MAATGGGRASWSRCTHLQMGTLLINLVHTAFYIANFSSFYASLAILRTEHYEGGCISWLLLFDALVMYHSCCSWLAMVVLP